MQHNFSQAAAAPAPDAPVWQVGRVTRSDAGGKLYNAVRIDNGAECSHTPTHSYVIAQRLVGALNVLARARARKGAAEARMLSEGQA